MTGDVLPWLPDRHLRVVSTLTHADELIAQVGDLLFDYMTQPDGVIELKEVVRGSYSETTVVGLAPIARKIPLLVADALVALRAAVEHTLFAEVEFLSGMALDEKAARSIEMPAALSYDKYAEWVRNRQRNAPVAMARGTELLRRVEGLQPFHRNIRPELHPMARLALHTNHAKHRTPAVTAVRLVTIVRDDEVPLSRHDVRLEPEVPLRIGDVIARTPLGQHVPVALFPTVGVNRPGSDQWPILMHELSELASWVREQAVPRLVTGQDPPPEKIPARYEITAPTRTSEGLSRGARSLPQRSAPSSGSGRRAPARA